VEDLKEEQIKSEPVKEVKSEAPEPPKAVESKPAPDSADAKKVAETTPTSPPKESVQASDDKIVTTASTDIEKADTVEKSVSSTPDLSDVKQIEHDSKVQNVKLPDSKPEVGGGENVVDSHEVIAASVDHVQKEEVVASSSAVSVSSKRTSFLLASSFSASA
jgi:hypothetical protein